MSPAAETQKLEEQPQEEDEEEEAEDGPEEAYAAPKSTAVPAMAARDKIGGHGRAVGVAGEHAEQKAL
jgi:hypothetical protein